MFCDNEKCFFDLWAPTGGVVANRAFSAYAMHQSEMDALADAIVQESDNYGADEGFHICFPEGMSESDLDYIGQQVKERSNGRLIWE